MASKDSYSTTKVFEGFGFTPFSGPVVFSAAIDTKGVESVLFAYVPEPTSIGSFAGTAIMSFEDNDISTSPSAPWEAVEEEFVVGNPTDEIIDTLRVPKKLGYVGKKRFVRLKVVTNPSPTPAMRAGGCWVLGVPLNAPTGVQP